MAARGKYGQFPRIMTVQKLKYIRKVAVTVTNHDWAVILHPVPVLQIGSYLLIALSAIPSVEKAQEEWYKVDHLRATTSSLLTQTSHLKVVLILSIFHDCSQYRSRIRFDTGFFLEAKTNRFCYFQVKTSASLYI